MHSMQTDFFYKRIDGVDIAGTKSQDGRSLDGWIAFAFATGLQESRAKIQDVWREFAGTAARPKLCREADLSYVGRPT